MKNGAYILHNGDNSLGVLSADGKIRTWSGKTPSELHLIMAVAGAAPVDIDPETFPDRKLAVKICALATAGDLNPVAVGETVIDMFLGFDDMRFVDSVPYLTVMSDRICRKPTYDSVWRFCRRFSKITHTPVWKKWAVRWKEILARRGASIWPRHAKTKNIVTRAIAEFGLTGKDREDLAAALAEGTR